MQPGNDEMAGEPTSKDRQRLGGKGTVKATAMHPIFAFPPNSYVECQCDGMRMCGMWEVISS